MGFFTSKKRGVTENEWKADRSRIFSVFGWTAAGKKRAQQVEQVVKAHLDPEPGHKEHRVMTQEELDDTLHTLEHDKTISKDEARKIRNVLERDMQD